MDEETLSPLLLFFLFGSFSWSLTLLSWRSRMLSRGMVRFRPASRHTWLRRLGQGTMAYAFRDRACGPLPQATVDWANRHYGLDLDAIDYHYHPGMVEVDWSKEGRVLLKNGQRIQVAGDTYVQQRGLGWGLSYFEHQGQCYWVPRWKPAQGDHGLPDSQASEPALKFLSFRRKNYQEGRLLTCTKSSQQRVSPTALDRAL